MKIVFNFAKINKGNVFSLREEGFNVYLVGRNRVGMYATNTGTYAAFRAACKTRQLEIKGYTYVTCAGAAKESLLKVKDNSTEYDKKLREIILSADVEYTAKTEMWYIKLHFKDGSVLSVPENGMLASILK